MLIVLLSISIPALLVLLILRNEKDKRQFENRLNNNYPGAANKENDVEIE